MGGVLYTTLVQGTQGTGPYCRVAPTPKHTEVRRVVRLCRTVVDSCHRPSMTKLSTSNRNIFNLSRPA